MTKFEIFERDIKNTNFGKNFTGKLTRDNGIKLVPDPSIDSELRILEVLTLWIDIPDYGGPEIRFQMKNRKGEITDYYVGPEYLFKCLKSEFVTEFVINLGKHYEVVK